MPECEKGEKPKCSCGDGASEGESVMVTGCMKKTRSEVDGQ
jgi:hypothetical protein